MFMGKGVLMLSFITLFVVRNFSVQGQRTMANSLAGIYSVAYVTVPNNDVAKKIAHGLVSEKLAACVNIIPQITSIYEWENKITEDNELLLRKSSLYSL
ncbi:hypothetical protein PV328_004466 [Microctonus aethiopoides]|uniref:Uncharacterized protein n=1 Tax=Microctonus aethiopoides TaxID=144406 RepID=A0AA39FAP0_9HYME|nr:hypothetical protein PV328_004466 [Microctonus aethiopoides]